MNGNDFDELDAEAREGYDSGGVPRASSSSPTAPGYRGVNRLVGAGAFGAVLFTAAFGFWAIGQRHSASPVGAATLALSPTIQESANPLPDPTGKPLVRATPRPVLAATPQPAPTVQPLPPMQPETVQQGGSAIGAPPAAAAVTAPKSPAQSAADQRAQLIAEAARTSGRMALAAPQDAAARDTAATVADVPSSRSNSSEAPHSGFLAEHSIAVGYTPSTSQFEINEATVIAARLVTAVDSTLPGLVKAQVTTPVYDSRTHGVVVIPAGAVLVGQYDSQTIAGEARLLAVWTRILFPNGTKFEMGPNEGTGAKGEAGLAGSVDTHAGRAFGNALLYTMLDAAGNLVSSSINRNRQIISINSATQAVQAPKQAAPTFHLYPGSAFNILVARDLPLAEYRPQ